MEEKKKMQEEVVIRIKKKSCLAFSLKDCFPSTDRVSFEK